MPTTLYEKVIAVIGMLRSSIDQKTSKLDLAPLFNTSVNYPVDSLVVYEKVLYACTTAHSGEWNASDFKTATIDDILRIKAKKADFAPEYSDTALYELNQLVIKNGAFMECTVAGYGVDAQFNEVTVAQVVARLDHAIKQAAAISQVYAILENIVPKYAVYTSYAVKDRCSYNGKLYECTTAVYASSSTPDETFWSTYWKTITVEEMVEEMLAGYVKSGSEASLQSLTMKDSSGPSADGPTITIGTANRLLVIDKLGVTVSDETGEDAQRIYFGTSKSGTIALLEDLAPNITTLQPDSSGKIVFKAGQMLVYGNELYLCTTGYSVDVDSEDPVWVEENWTECTIDAVFNALLDSMSELANSALSYAFVDTQSNFVKASTTGVISSTQYAPVGRIFIEPEKFNLSGIVGVMTTLISVNNRGNYDSFYFNPSYVGMTNGQFLNGVTLYLATAQSGTDHAQQGDTIIAKLHKIDGESDLIVAQSDEITWPAAPANNTDESGSPVAANFKFSSDNQIADVSLMYYVTFHRKNGDTFEDTKIRIRSVAATRQNSLLYIGGNKHLTLCDIAFSDCTSGDSCNAKIFSVADQESVYMHLCKLPSGFSRSRFAEGEVVAVSNAKTLASGENSIYVTIVPEFDTTSCYFVAFDRTRHDVGTTFGGGVSLLMNLFPTSYTFDSMGLSCDGDAFVPQMIVDGVPIKGTEDSHIPILVYRDTFSQGYVPLPNKDAEMELRYIIYGVSGRTLDFHEGVNEIIPLNGDTTWKTLSAGSRYVFVFKSVGKTIGEIYGNFDNPAQLTEHTIGFKRLWTVERYSA